MRILNEESSEQNLLQINTFNANRIRGNLVKHLANFYNVRMEYMKIDDWLMNWFDELYWWIDGLLYLFRILISRDK